MDGFGLPSQIVKRAKEIGRTSIALTDHGSVSGYVQLMKACKEQGINPVYGYEAYIVPSLQTMFDEKIREKSHITILASNLEGYRNVLKLASLAYQKGFYYRPTIDSEMLFQNSNGLIVLSGCWSGFVQKALKEKDFDSAKRIANSFKSIFKDRYFLETQHFPLFKDTIAGLEYVSKELDIPMVLTCDPHYLTSDQSKYQEILHAVRDRRLFDASKIIEGAYQWPAEELFEAVSTLFPDVKWQQLFENTVQIAERCNVKMPVGGAPTFPVEIGQNAFDVLVTFCKDGIKKRNLIGAGNAYRERLNIELKLIRDKKFADYFLIVADAVNWAKKEDIYVGPARGSSAGSLVCFLTGITEIDPIAHGLLFERFLAPDRFDLPDIDIDFEDKRREEVKDYISRKYGEDKVCSVSVFARFKGRNSLDEIGKMFSVPKTEVNEIKKYLLVRSGMDMRVALTIEDTFQMSEYAQAAVQKYPDMRNAIGLEGQLRHMGKHAAGIIVGDRPLEEVMALYEKDGHRLSSLEMKDAAEIGLLKIDILGITELSIIANTTKMIGMTLQDLYALPLTDEKTMQGFRDVDVDGIFQFDGDSTKSVLRQMVDLKNFRQLVDCVTLSKPGPAHAGGTSSYIARSRGKQTAGFDFNPVLANITKDTFGQIIYQEQVLAICREVGKLTWTDANRIRLFISKSAGEAGFEQYWSAFKKGAEENGLNEQQARKIWDGIKTFGRWAFNLSHAVSYAMVAWWSMYLKVHHPLEFYLSCLLNEDNKDDKIRLLRSISNHGIKILPPKLGVSDVGWKIDDGSLRAGLSDVKGIGNVLATKLISEKYMTESDFANKKVRGVTKRTLQCLKDAGALDENNEADYFGLHDYDILNNFCKEREKIIDIQDWSESYELTVAGMFKEMNYKDVHEEARSRGKSSANTKNPEISKYAMLIIEDDTDRCLVNIDRYLFNKIGQNVWDAYNNGNYVVVKGMKVGGWRIIRAKDFAMYSKDGKKIFEYGVDRTKKVKVYRAIQQKPVISLQENLFDDL